MLGNFVRCFARFVAGVAVLVPFAGAEAAKLNASCKRDQAAAVVCEVLSEPGKVINQVTVLNGTQTLKSEFENFSATSKTPAWYFLIQQSNPNDALAAVQQMIKHEGKRKYGVGFFLDKLDEKASLGSNDAEIRRITPVDAKTEWPELYYAAYQAITKLVETTADRKSLVIFTNGTAKSSSYKEKFVQAAKDNNILVHVIQMGGDKQPALLNELRDDTNGLLDVAEACNKKTEPGCRTYMVSSTLVSNFRSYLENGGTVRIKSVVSENAELTIRINNSGATSPVEERVKITTPAPIPPNPPKPDDLTLWEKWMDYAKANPLPVYGTGAATIAALLAGVFLLSRMRQRVLPIYADGQHHDDDAMGTIGRGAGGGRDTQILSGSDTIVLNPNAHFDRIAPHQVYGWLQFLDQGSTRIPIGATSVRIGRHKDNDICLENKTVHRQHAVLHMSPDRRFSIRDLGTVNGLMVNSEKVAQRELTDGDMIELGEVRMRFFANNESIH